MLFLATAPPWNNEFSFFLFPFFRRSFLVFVCKSTNSIVASILVHESTDSIVICRISVLDRVLLWITLELVTAASYKCGQATSPSWVVFVRLTGCVNTCMVSNSHAMRGSLRSHEQLFSSHLILCDWSLWNTTMLQT